jgi:hypothetical protein
MARVNIVLLSSFDRLYLQSHLYTLSLNPSFSREQRGKRMWYVLYDQVVGRT